MMKADLTLFASGEPMSWKLSFSLHAREFLLIAVFAVTGTFLTVVSYPRQTYAQNSPQKSVLDDFGSRFRQKAPIKEKPRNDAGPGAVDQDAIVVETNLVINVVTILDEHGAAVSGLSKEDFTLTEDGVVRELELVRPDDSQAAPRSIVLLIDHSASQLPYIETSIEAAKILIDNLCPKDKMAIATDNIEVLQDFTADKAVLKEKLEGLKQGAIRGKFGKSRQFSALVAVMEDLFRESDRRPIVIFQTDGDEFFDLKPIKDSGFKMTGKSGFGFSDIESLAQNTRSTIYGIMPGIRTKELSQEQQELQALAYLSKSDEAYAAALKIKFTPKRSSTVNNSVKTFARYYRKQQDAIEVLATKTGGSIEYLNETESAQKVYERILKFINSSYVLGFYPADEVRSSRPRKLSVTVKGHPEYRVVGRDSYILATRPD
jgi:VWFA-related protein